MYIHINVTTIMKSKVMNLKESKEGWWEVEAREE